MNRTHSSACEPSSVIGYSLPLVISEVAQLNELFAAAKIGEPNFRQRELMIRRPQVR